MLNRFIFPAILVAIINAIILGKQWWLISILCFWIIRILFLKERKVFWITCGIGIFAAIFFSIQANKVVVPKKVNDDQVMISGTVLADEISFNGGQYKMLLKTADQKKVMLYGSSSDAQFKQALISNTKTLKVQAKIKYIPMQKTHNFGGFDVEKYYEIQKIYGAAEVIKLAGVSQKPQKTLSDVLHTIRKHSINYFEKLPKYLRFYAETLILGYARVDFYQENIGITTLGLVHLFSISGFQVGLFCNFIRFFLKRLHFFQESTAIIIIVFLPLYFIFSGSLISLIRPIIAAILIESSYLYQNKLTKLDVWSCTLLGGLIFQPLVLLTYGGQLSYLLAFGLVFVEKVGYFKQIFLLNMFTLPVILAHSYQWHFLVLIINFLLLPIFSYGVVPLTIVGTIVFSFFPLLSGCINLLIKWLNQFITTMAELPGLIIFGKISLIFELIILVITAILLTSYKSKKLWIALLFFYGINYFFIHNPFQNLIAFIDVGQGDSTLIKKNNNTTLIDTGGKLNFANYYKNWQKPERKPEAGASYSVIPYLKSLGISSLNNMILTHGDADHIGDLKVVLAEVKVENLFVGLGMESDRNLKKLQRKYHFRINTLKSGSIINSVNLAVLMPNKKGNGKNEDSVVTAGIFGKQSFIFMGDLDKNGEKTIIDNYPNLRANVIKLGHHGSKTSSSSKFIRQLQPQLAIISAGFKNRYGHPHLETIKTLKNNHVNYLITAKEGMIIYHWNMFGNYWQTKLREK